MGEASLKVRLIANARGRDRVIFRAIKTRVDRTIARHNDDPLKQHVMEVALTTAVHDLIPAAA